MRSKDEVKYAFTPVGKLNKVQENCLLKLQVAFIELGTEIIDLVPNCADRTSALRKLQEAKFTCVQAITHFVEPTKAEKVDAAKNSQ